MCVEGSLPEFPSNLGMFYGSFEGITDREGLWAIGSFFICKKSGKYNVARKYNDI
jgi:hypothetical protein